MTFKLNSKIDFLLLLIIATLIYISRAQNGYPSIISGSATFLSLNSTVPYQYDITYSNPIPFGPPIKCIHALNGFGFQTSILQIQTFFNFTTDIISCTNSMITMYSVFSDTYLT